MASISVDLRAPSKLPARSLKITQSVITKTGLLAFTTDHIADLTCCESSANAVALEPVGGITIGAVDVNSRLCDCREGT